MPGKLFLSAPLARAAFAAACALLLFFALPQRDAFSASIDVFASGLDNPRGIFVRGNNIVYVAEAGRGGSRCAEVTQDGETAEFCFGSTGAVMKIWPGGKLRLVRGLPSVAEDRSGAFAVGPHDVGRLNHRIFIAMGQPPAPAVPLFGTSTRLQGKLVRWLHGDVDVVADLAAYERRRNPAGGEIYSNPYGLHVASVGQQLVADAGANDLLSVRGGRIATVAVFPPQMADAPPFLGLPPGTKIPAESVPTAVTRGPDGAYYVGELTGFPFPIGKARIWRVVPGRAPEVFATGFTNIIDLTFGPNGSLYVLEFARAGLLAAETGGELPAGRLVGVASNGTQTELAAGRLVAPGGVAVARNGWIYVTNRSVLPGAGEVLRIRP